MANEGKILDLVLNGAGKCASDLTHDLRIVGNGDMAEGITQIADFCIDAGFDAGEKLGTKKGIGIGLAIAAIGVGVHVIYKWHIKNVEKRAAMWQRFDDDCRASDKEHWAEYKVLKEKVAQQETKDEEEATEDPAVEPVI